MGLSHYESIDVPARALELRTREDAEDADLAADVGEASMLFFSGGSPRYLADTLAGTRFWTAVLEAVGRGAVYAGCSAGAMVVGRRPTRRPVVGGRWLVGLDLVPHARFGAHWNRMRYLPGLRGARDADGGWFVGIDERTAILGDGRTWTVHGRASVEVRGRIRRAYRDGESFTLA